MMKVNDWITRWLRHAQIDPWHWQSLVERADPKGLVDPQGIPEDILELLRRGRFLLSVAPPGWDRVWLNPSYSGKGRNQEVWDAWNQEYLRQARERLKAKLEGKEQP